MGRMGGLGSTIFRLYRARFQIEFAFRDAK